MRRWWRKVWLVALAGCWAATAAAASRWERLADPLFVKVSAGAGIPDRFVATAIVEDGAGFLWVGSQSGLYRWDGHGFRHFQPGAGVAGSLPDGIIQTLHRDPKGRLWVGMASRGLARYDPQTERFETYTLAGPDGMERGVNAIADAPHGRLWVGTENGLVQLDPATRRATSTQLVPEGAPQSIDALLTDQLGQLWIGTADGLMRLPPYGGQLQRIAQGARPYRAVTCLLQDDRGRIWVGTRNHGVRLLDARSGQELEAPAGAVSSSIGIAALAQSDNGTVWIGTDGRGIFQVAADTLEQRRIGKDALASNALDDNSIWSLYRGLDGAIWVGSAVSLLRHPPDSGAVLTVRAGRQSRAGLSDLAGDSLALGPDGRLWVGAGADGMELLDPQAGRVGAIRLSRVSALQARVVRALEGPAGELLMGTYLGLYRASPEGKQLRRIAIEGRADSPVWAMLVDGEGLWVGGLDGLWFIESLPARAHHVPAVRVVDGLDDSRLSALASAGPNALWVGTRGGLFRLDKTTLRAARTAFANGPAGLDGAYISALHVDDAHRLWAGTSDRGLFVILDPESPAAQVRHIDSAHGLPSNQISAVVPDDEGGLWVATDKGLARVDMQSLQVRMLSAADGVSIQDYWAFAAAKSASGEVYFGGDGGLTVIRPQRLPPQPVPRPPVMTALQVDGRNMPMAAVADRDNPRTLMLPLDYREAAIEFSALELGHGARLRYGHRLGTVHADWIETDASRRYVVLPRLPPGEHRLQVRAGEPGGPWSPPLELVVRVQPFWYESSWARALFAMAAVVGVMALIQLRTRLLRRRQRVLELAVAERTAALDASQHALRELGDHNALALEEERKHVSRELHDEMGQQLAALRMEVSVMGMRMRASQPPQPEQFDMLLGRVDQLVRSVRGLVSQLRPPALDGGLAAALEWLGDEFRRSTGIACELEIDRTVCELAPRQATVVFRIAQESLTNVRRHANASQVTLQLQRDPPGVVLTVRDNGAGFDTAARRHGHGLLGMQERARLLRGELTVTSVPGSGTTVVLRTQP